MKKRKNKKHIGHFEYKYLPEFVYGGMDGAITVFAIVAGVMGAALSSIVILVLGFATLFADGFSMAASNYLSTKSQNEIKPLGKNPIKTALATFVSFLVIGFIPLIPFIFSSRNTFTYSIILTASALAVVGAIKGGVVGKRVIWSAVQTLMIGGIAAGLAFLVGYLIKGIL